MSARFVALTVYVFAARACAVLPVISPVFVSKLNPVGRSGEIVKVTPLFVLDILLVVLETGTRWTLSVVLVVVSK